MHKFNPSIFREYDIRGIFNETLTLDDAYWIGRSYAQKREKGKIAIGYDGRLSSPALSEALAKGLNDGGIDVVDIGLVPTPATYFAVFHLNLDGGIMVTGSHNPPDHNGFKIMLGKDSLHGEQIRQLADLEIRDSGQEIRGKVEQYDIKPEYIKKLLSNFNSQIPNLAIGWDPGNGAAGEIIEMLAPELSAKHSLLNTKIDGTFPSHHPDPTVEKNLGQLKEEIAKHKLDVGFAFDGDGDRVGIVDGKGRPIWGDQILAILAKDIAKKYPGAPIVADVKTSSTVFDYIASLGLKPVMWKTGHSLIKAKMKELNAPLAGEMSAHIFFADDYYGYDDGILAAIRFLKIMVESGKSAAELLDELPKTFSTPEIRFEVPEERKFAIVEEIKTALLAEGTEFSDIDGVRAQLGSGWWLLRASNTGNHLVARAEADSEASLEELKAELNKHLKARL